MAEQFEIQQTIQILQSDTDLLEAFSNDSIIVNDEQYFLLAEVMANNSAIVYGNTVRDLVSSNFLSAEISAIFGVEISENVLTHILYSFKYASVKRFFIKNYQKFFPEYDYTQITSAEKTKLFVESFMREFDRFSLIIDNIYNAVDINKIPIAYLQYLGQLVGYEKQDDLLITDISFRELLKNIIEIYRIKGTNYSFELFFNFLGFTINIQEFWFDRRFGDVNININPYTSSIDKNSHLFYLTPIKPTDGIPEGVSNTNRYVITEDNIKETLSLEMFDKYTEWYNGGDTRGFTPKQLMGFDAGFTGDTYTYFKSNAIQYSLSSLNSGQEAELTSEEITVIDIYAKFLTPIFVKRRIVLVAVPYRDYAFLSGITMRDYDRLDPVYRGEQIEGTLWQFRVKSIDVNAGDTFNTRSTVVVYDTNQILYNNIRYWDVAELTGDTNGDTAAGIYPVWGDTIGDSHPGDTYGKAVSYFGGYTTIMFPYILNGNNRGEDGAYIKVGARESMFQIHSGKYPSRYYWGDTTTLMNYAGDTTSVVPPGGLFVSGYHNDTRTAVYDPSYALSAYSRTKTLNPTWNEEQILSYVNGLLRQGDSLSGLFNYTSSSTYKVRRRDLLLPVDTERNMHPGDTRSRAGDSWILYYQHRPTGDSFSMPVWVRHGGFINPVISYDEEDASDVDNVTLGMNLAMGVNDSSRISEEQYIDRIRRDYFSIDYAYNDRFNYDTVIQGKRSGFAVRMLSKGGDSKFVALLKVGGFTTGDTIYTVGGGDSATLNSITYKTDNRGMVLLVDVLNAGKGLIKVHDLGGDTYNNYAKLNRDDYVGFWGVGDTKIEGRSFKVSSTTITGDTTTIIFGDSLPGVDRGLGGYIFIDNICRIQYTDKSNINSLGEVGVYDVSRRLAFLKAGDTIRVRNIGLGNLNEGVYTLNLDSVHTRSGTGDSVGITVMEFTTQLGGSDGDSKGIVEIYSTPWTMNNDTYRQHDYVEVIRTQA